MALKTEKLSYEADRRTMTADLYFDDTAAEARPGILVFPDALGIGKFSRERAARLAVLGFVALACDLHGDGRRYTSDTVGPIFEPVYNNPQIILALAQAGLDQLCARPEVDARRIAAIGYCFGGLMGLELARNGAPLKAVVGFHAGLKTWHPDRAKAIQGKVLACIGSDDAHVTAEERAEFEREMRAAGVDWRLHIYGGVLHSFTDPDAGDMGRPDFARYDPGADKRSWREMLELLEEVFG